MASVSYIRHIRRQLRKRKRTINGQKTRFYHTQQRGNVDVSDKLVREYSEEVYIEKFGESGCPRCKDRHVKCFERTKDGNEYRIYVCDKCKIVLGREMS